MPSLQDRQSKSKTSKPSLNNINNTVVFKSFKENFYKSLNIITLGYYGCEDTLNFIKIGIHFNLYQTEDITTFFTKCIDFEFDF